MNVKKNDQVLVTAGKDRGTRGRVLRVLASKGKAIVERVNMIKRHTRPNPNKGIQGGILEREAPIQVSNLQVICPECGKPSRLGRTRLEDGRGVRVCKNCGANLARRVRLDMAKNKDSKTPGQGQGKGRGAAPTGPCAPTPGRLRAATQESGTRKRSCPKIQKEFGIDNADGGAAGSRRSSLNMGVGEAIQNIKILDDAVEELAAIAGQRPAITRAQKSIAAFKLREGMPIGARVTLRGEPDVGVPRPADQHRAAARARLPRRADEELRRPRQLHPGHPRPPDLPRDRLQQGREGRRG